MNPAMPPASSRHGLHTRQDAFDKAILKELTSTIEEIKNCGNEEKETEVHLYCKSLIPIISALPLRKQRMACMKISQLLFELEFESE